MKEFKIILIGGANKASFTSQVFKYNENYSAALESNLFDISIKEQKYVVDIIDVQEEYSAMRDQFIRKGDGFLLYLDKTDARPFEVILNNIKQITRAKDTIKLAIVLIGPPPR